MYQLRNTTAEVMAELLKEYKRFQEDPYANVMINNIGQGYITVNYDTYEMRERKIAEIGQSIVMPKEFKLMNDAKKKYPTEYQPQLIFTDDRYETDLTFTLTDYNVASEDELVTICDSMVDRVKDREDITEIDDIELLIPEDKPIALSCLRWSGMATAVL